MILESLSVEFIESKMKVNAIRTNIDTIIGKTGTVKKRIDENTGGIAKIGNEEWKAISKRGISIEEGESVRVVSVAGVTLTVEKTN